MDVLLEEMVMVIEWVCLFLFLFVCLFVLDYNFKLFSRRRLCVFIIYIYVLIYVYMCVYIYICIERERDGWVGRRIKKGWCEWEESMKKDGGTETKERLVLGIRISTVLASSISYFYKQNL
ncbi:hypothetical protein Hanom_Chr03g00248271 [Helianthus anomalus]